MEVKVLNNYIEYIFNNLKNDDETFDSTLIKKLKYLGKNITENIFIKNYRNGENMLIDTYSHLLKNGANYLRLDSMQVVKEFLGNGCLENLTFEQLLGKFCLV